MLISPRQQATTTPWTRAAIEPHGAPAWVGAARYGISRQRVWTRRKRDAPEDRSHMPHRLTTTMTPAEKAVAVSPRGTLLLPLGDLLAVERVLPNLNGRNPGIERTRPAQTAADARRLPRATPTARPR